MSAPDDHEVDLAGASAATHCYQVLVLTEPDCEAAVVVR